MRLGALFALTFVLASLGSASATWQNLLAPAQPALEAAGQGGVTGTLAGTLGEAPEPPEPQGLANYACGGTAPLTTTCFQDLAGAPGANYRLFVNGGTGFTGTIIAALTDLEGNTVVWTCSYTLFIGGVTPAPTCGASGTGSLVAGPLRLAGAVGEAAQGAPSAGYWEVGVEVEG